MLEEMTLLESRTRLEGTDLDFYRLGKIADEGIGDTNKLPFTVKILLEGVLRDFENDKATEVSLKALANWPADPPPEAEVPYTPSRVLLQDFTGVPAVVDHSVQVDAFGSTDAYNANIKREYERNSERYALLRWAQQAFQSFSVVPPGMGICHQVNLERLSTVVQVRKDDAGGFAIP